MDDIELLQSMINDAGLEGWEVISEVSIDCPHGYSIEHDGTCPEGCVSAVRQIGMI